MLRSDTILYTMASTQVVNTISRHGEHIQRLPPEMLSTIFEFALSPEYSCKDLLHSTPHIDRLSAPFSLRRVCHKWNTVALTTPQLWTTIYPNIIHEVPLLTSFLQLSGSLPLAIHIHLTLDENSSGISREFLEGLSLLKQSLYRCRRLQLYGFNSGVVFEKLFPAGTHTETPLLEEFIIAHPLSDEVRDLGLVHAPSLRVLALPSCPRHEFTSAFRPPLTSIQCLTFLDCAYYFHRTRTHQLIPFLRQLPNLRESRLYIPNFNDPNANLEESLSLPIILPHLYDLNVTWLGDADADVVHLFRLLQTPSLRHLSLQAHSSSTNLDLGTVLPKHITHLHLTNFEFRKTVIAFDELVALEEVWFKKCHQVEEFLEGNIMRLDVCPKLRSLVFELCDFHRGVLVEVVEQRSSAALKSVNLIRCRLSDELREWLDHRTDGVEVTETVRCHDTFAGHASHSRVI
jgi:F-box-like